MKYMGLDQKGYTMAEYIWIDGSNGVRSKTKVRVLLNFPPRTASMQASSYFWCGRGSYLTEALLSANRIKP